MIRYFAEPWTTWPRKKTDSYSRTSPFKAGLQDTLSILDRELRHLKAETVILQLDADRLQVRQDGVIRETTTTRIPGVIVTISRPGKPPMTLPCDDCRKWQDNLRAIAKTLEHLRGADRYGVTASGEQYRGWEALPPPGGGSLAMTLDAALDLIGKLSGIPQHTIQSNPRLRTAAIREARVVIHPDKGGRAEDAAMVDEAARILEKELT